VIFHEDMLMKKSKLMKHMKVF